MHEIRIKRGTRAQIEAAKLSGILAEGEPYLITDEHTIGVGTGTDSYSVMIPEIPLVQSVVSASTVEPTFNTEITALATNITFTNPSGNYSDFQKILIRIKDNGAPRSISWGTNFVSGGIDLPTETVAGKISHIGLIWSSALSKWMCIASVTEE